MRHYSNFDLWVFDAERKFSGGNIIVGLTKLGSTFFLDLRDSPFLIKFVANFPGYRLVHIPRSEFKGEVILRDLFPARVKLSKILNNDRIYGFWCENNHQEFALIFELIGSLSNLYVINENGKVIYMARWIKDKRMLRPGVVYSLPEKSSAMKPSFLNDFGETNPIKKGWICSEENGNIVFSHVPIHSNCVAYEPYTYALDVFFEKLYPSEKREILDKDTIEKFINVLSSELPADFIFSEDIYKSKSGIEIPVKKGERVSQAIGRYKGMLLKIDQPRREENKIGEDIKYLEFYSPSGKRVLVGRDAKSNQRLTFNYAKAKDYVFHVKDYPGAHVLLVTDGSQPTPEDILFCAEKAVQFSKIGKGKCEVIYAPVSDVYRKKGLKPGVILFKRYKSVVVEK